ncbi:fibronectin type III domain-containing protein [Actinoplanes sp. NPDC049265]|uniref:fibronectin type III domain-containing protein n=1 Tax=Actinoplanes sp. NPDC049265 TaxID=3363902 RepID=UPI003718AAED
MTTSKPPWRTRGGLVTIGTVLTLVTGLGLTVLGLGAADQAVASFDAASWVWSKGKGEVARVNGVTAKVDTRVDVPAARNHTMQISQNDRFVIYRDVNTGVISSMDLTSLKTYATTPTNSGLGVSVALRDDAAFVVDSVRGVVRQIDPRYLTPVGQPLNYPPGITGGVFDGKGRLWVGVPSQGTVSAITAARIASDAPQGGGQAAAAGPVQVSTTSVAPASHDLAITTLDDGVAVLNRTTNALTTVRGDQKAVPTQLPLAGPGTVAPQTWGLSIPVTVPDAREVYIVRDGKMGPRFQVPGDGPDLAAAVAWEGFFYVAEEDSGTVHVFDGQGREQKSIGVPNPGGPLELEVRENYLFINAPGSSTARVVDNQHQVRVVDKYADDVLGGDAPPAPDTPPPPPKPKKPQVDKPGAPRNVRAAAGNAEARVTWQSADPHGAPVTRYVVTGAGKTFQVGANQRSVNVPGLTNGETYRFEVHAVNKKGDGPAKTSNAVRPTAEVPDAPTAATAEAKADGTVTVSWPAANGQGLDIERYTVTAISEGGSAPVGESDKPSLTIKGGELEYGKQYAFTVVAVNERGAGSKASPVSNSVVPYAKPEAPQNVDAATVSGQKGAIRATWSPAAENGRPITKYVVTAGGRSVDVPEGNQVTMTGFGDGATVRVEVRAVNDAGEGAPGSATAKTVALPQVTITGASSTFNTGTVTFSVNAGGGTATCTVKTNPDNKSAGGSCSSLKVTGLKPSTAYDFTVTAKNAAGVTTSKPRRVTTANIYGVATCNNGEKGDTAHYCDKDVDGRNGNEIFSVTKQDDGKQVGWAKPGTRLQAYCKKSGEEVYAYIYNRDKRSTWWVRISYKDKKPYIPWAWINLDGGDKLANLPTC